VDATTQQIAHLMRRAGFSCGAEELQQRAAKGLDATINELVRYEEQPDVDDLFDAYARTQYSDPPLTFKEIQQFWLHRMIKSPRQLQEKMSLFWHGHFATSNYKVNNTGYMLGQYLFFRKNALGDFRTILQGISRDPAMLVWLDNIYNTKRAPNENYAREVMELFSLGTGNYTEGDIRQAARAFTGWQIKSDKFWVNIRDHDFTDKTVLGVTGRLNGDDVIDILVAHPATAQFMARKLLRFFATERPSQQWVDRIAGVFRSTNGNMRAVVEAIFRSNEFFAPLADNRTHKSPAEFAVGAIREFDGMLSLETTANHVRMMGQDLFNPPTVKGWDGGENWVNTSTLLARINFAGDLTNNRVRGFATSSLYNALLQDGVNTATGVVDFYEERLNGVPLAAETRNVVVNYLNTSSSGVTGPFKLTSTSANVKVRNAVRLILSAPEYQFNWECKAPTAQPLGSSPPPAGTRPVSSGRRSL
jgi:uncharacterized protein (DUF1800 family)